MLAANLAFVDHAQQRAEFDRRDWRLISSDTCVLQLARQLRTNPISRGARVATDLNRAFVIVGQRALSSQLGGISERQTVRLGKAFGSRARQLGQSFAHLIDELIGDDQRRQVRLGKITIVVGLFLRTHRPRLSQLFIPQTRLLDQTPAGFQSVDLALDFKLDRALHEPN